MDALTFAKKWVIGRDLNAHEFFADIEKLDLKADLANKENAPPWLVEAIENRAITCERQKLEAKQHAAQLNQRPGRMPEVKETSKPAVKKATATKA